MGNTLLYRNNKTGEVAYYRKWPGGKGSFTLYSHDLKGLIRAMKSDIFLFEEPFEPEGGVPKRDFGNIDPTKFSALKKREVDTVVEYLRN